MVTDPIRLVISSGFSSFIPINGCKRGSLALSLWKRTFSEHIICRSETKRSREELLVVVGGGAAGVYGVIQAKTVAANLSVVIIEKGKPLAKVKVSGGGQCNVTSGHCADNMFFFNN